MAPIKLLVFFIFLQLTIATAQNFELGVPYYQNITPEEIGYGDPVYSIAQTPIGTICFGNFNGLLMYNGSKWKNYSWNGRPILHQTQNNSIFIGGFNTISKLSITNNQKYSFESLIDSTYDFGQIEKIIEYQNRIYFVANKVLYYISNNKVVKLLDDTEFIHIFTDRNRLFISSSNGVYEFLNERAENSSISDFFKHKKIIDMFRYANKLIARTTDSFYIINNNIIEPFYTEIDSDLQAYEYTVAKKLSNNMLAIGTKKNGLYFINESGKLITHLHSNNGLYDNIINDLFIDKANNLWAGFSNGVCRIEIPSAFTYFNRGTELQGKVTSIVRHKGGVYVGTEKGVYKMNNEEFKNDKFELVTHDKDQCNTLYSYKNSLLVGSNSGLYEITPRATRKVLSTDIVAVHSSSESNIVWACSKNYVYVLQSSKTNLELIQTIGPFYVDINSVVSQADTVAWLGTYYGGVYAVHNTNGAFSISEYYNSSGLPAQAPWVEVYQSSGGTLFSTATGLYRFDADINMFYKDTKISIPLEFSNQRVSPIVEDDEKNLWLAFKSQGTYENQIAVAWNNGNQNRYTLIINQFNKLNKFICSVIFPDAGSIVWFGGFDGLVRMNFKELYTKKNNEATHILSIYIGKDSLYENYKRRNVFNHLHNTIRIEFATPIYENSEKILHTYLLEGFSDSWSEPEHISFKEYANLPAGDYTFRVKAIDIYGNKSPESTFAFKVKSHPLLRWWAFIMYAIVLLSLIILTFRWRSYIFLKEKTKLSKIIRQRTEDLLIEKEKTETILRNMLPEHTAQELKEKGRATSMRFEMATILFSDIQGFTQIAEQIPPDKLIHELDKFFLEFDTIVERYNIEKIKTIGDAYMCAGGIPEKNRTNPIDVVVAALEMQYKVRLLQQHNEDNTLWGLRIGIHTGPVIAGVVGSKKYSYDIWGDSVNIASRMESAGEVGKVNVSETTYLLIQEFFMCEYRGKVPVKNKGEIDMYFVNGFKPQFAHKPLKVTPNKHFIHKLALLKFEDLHEYMLEKFEKELPKNLYYHNIKHTIDVTVQVEIIGHEEGVSDDDMLLLKTAALFHDAGFLVGYNNHEEIGIQLAHMILPKFNYTPEQIRMISEIITATKIPHNPKNKLEEIMCDADLDYLGRNDYLAVSRDLYRELIEHGALQKSEMEWNVMQIKFMQKHKYFTESSQRRRNAHKNKQIQYLQEQTKHFKI